METTTEKTVIVERRDDSDSPLVWILLVILLVGLFGGCRVHHRGPRIHGGVPHPHVVHGR